MDANRPLDHVLITVLFALFALLVSAVGMAVVAAYYGHYVPLAGLTLGAALLWGGWRLAVRLSRPLT